jgi:hypothetical protein
VATIEADVALPPAMRAVLASQPYLSLKEIASRWAPELKVTYSWLAAALANFALSNDDVELMIWDQLDLTISNVKAADLRANFSRLAHNRRQLFGQVAAEAVKKHWIFLRPEVIWRFCRSTNLAAPSFWPVPKTKSVASRPGNIPIKLEAFHQGRPKETEGEAKAAANANPEISGKFTDLQWRMAWGARDPATKFGRGRRKSGKPAKA